MAGTTQNYCGVKLGEVFTSSALGRGYVGEFNFGAGPGNDPYGWLHCLANCENTSFFADLFGQYDPQNPPCRCSNTIKTPRANVPFGKGAAYALASADATGPVGLEDAIAMHVGLDGTLDNNVAFAGGQVYNDGVGRWETGLLDNDTGWHKDTAVDKWVFECYARISDDGGTYAGPGGGQFMDGATLSFHMAAKGHSHAAVTGVLSTTNLLALTGDYQFFRVIFSGLSNGFSTTADWYWPIIHISSAHTETTTYDILWFGSVKHRSGYASRGEVAIKCPHLYPYNQTRAVWIDDFHGHG